MLAVELITETDDLMNIRKHYVGEHASDLNTTLERLMRYVTSRGFSYFFNEQLLRRTKRFQSHCNTLQCYFSEAWQRSSESSVRS